MDKVNEAAFAGALLRPCCTQSLDVQGMMIDVQLDQDRLARGCLHKLQQCGEGERRRFCWCAPVLHVQRPDVPDIGVSDIGIGVLSVHWAGLCVRHVDSKTMLYGDFSSSLVGVDLCCQSCWDSNHVGTCV